MAENTDTQNNKNKDERCVVFHGFNLEEVKKLLALIKANASNSENVAFAMTTPTNLNWPVSELIDDLREHHDLTLKQKALLREKQGE